MFWQVMVSTFSIAKVHIIKKINLIAGWNYTKLSDVSLQRISSTGELLNNANLINQKGCLNPSMQFICSHAPIFDAPLGNRLTFKAVMFQGMKSGDELQLSIRIHGCLDKNDCHLNIHQDCHNAALSIGRRRREIMKNSKNDSNAEISEISKISFRVILPKENQIMSDDMDKDTEENIQFHNEGKSWILFGSLGFVALMALLAAILVCKLR